MYEILGTDEGSRDVAKSSVDLWPVLPSWLGIVLIVCQFVNFQGQK